MKAAAAGGLDGSRSGKALATPAGLGGLLCLRQLRVKGDEEEEGARWLLLLLAGEGELQRTRSPADSRVDGDAWVRGLRSRGKGTRARGEGSGDERPAAALLFSSGSSKEKQHGDADRAEWRSCPRWVGRALREPERAMVAWGDRGKARRGHVAACEWPRAAAGGG